MYRAATILFMLLLTLNLFPQNAPASLRVASLLSAADISTLAAGQPLGERLVPGRLVVVYRGGTVPSNADAIAAIAGARSVRHLRRLGVSALQVDLHTETAAIARLQSQPQVAAVLEDRYVQGHALLFRPGLPAATALPPGDPAPSSIPHTIQTVATPAGGQPLSLPRPLAIVRRGSPTSNPTTPTAAIPVTTSPAEPQPASPAPAAPAPAVPDPAVPDPASPDPASPAPAAPDPDSFYNSPQGWAVLQAGGYGDNVPGGPSTGPWTTTLGAGVRIAILDSGVDENHPDIAPNLALNLSEIDQTALPSPCDDGSPQDQQGHGTWAASLAAAALGPGTGQVAGTAPQATILNIKVLQRMPAATGATLAAQCEAGQPGGLLSWVLQGINDAVANHANVISVSLGTLVDITTGDGAGWQAEFNSATYAASQAGVVIVAALGNDGLNLSPTGPNARYIELPAQARGVLPVVASTNPACAEDLAAGAVCAPGPVTRPYYSNYGVANALAAPGGSYPEGSDTGVSGFIRGACSSGLPNTTDGLPSTTSGGSPSQSFGCFNLGHVAYVQAMGTSASAPLVAGAAALLHAAHPGWTAAQILSELQNTATTASSMTEPQLNLPAALASNSSFAP